MLKLNLLIRGAAATICFCGIAVTMSACPRGFPCGYCISIEGNAVYTGVETHSFTVKDSHAGEIISKVILTKTTEPPWLIVKDNCSGEKVPCKVEVRLTEYKPIQRGGLVVEAADSGTKELTLESK
jgi:hypothetical protein